MNLKERLKRVTLIRWIVQNIKLCREDLTLRGWGVLCQALVGWLPDWFCFNFLRVGALWVAGAKLPIAGGIVIRKGVFVEIPSKLQLGIGVQINKNTYIGSNVSIKIGDFSRIAMNVQMLTVSHDGPKFERDVYKTITINNHSHIGAGAILLPGAEIGEGSLVAPGAVFTGSAKEHGVYVGNPARFVGPRS